MKKTACIWFLSIAILVAGATSATGKEVVVYSARNEHLIRPIFEAYTAQTGVKVRFLTGKAPVLLQRLMAEGKNSRADLLITVDAGNLWHAANEGILQPIDSAALRANIPAHLRDPDQRWFGLSVRARTIVYSTERVRPAALNTYEELAGSKWIDRLLLRTSKKVYNQSLVAMLISRHGAAKTEKIVSGWVDNLATAPFSNDTKVMQAIAAGQGDIGIVNTYYFGRLQKKDPDIPLALFWPNQNDGGVHVNISGAGVTAHSRNRQAAIALLEWLSSAEAQKLFAGLNLEYPANPNIKPDPLVDSWGDFKHSPINLTNAGLHQAEAIRLMDRAGYR